MTQQFCDPHTTTELLSISWQNDPQRENALIFSYFLLKFFKKMCEDQYGFGE